MFTYFSVPLATVPYMGKLRLTERVVFGLIWSRWCLSEEQAKQGNRTFMDSQLRAICYYPISDIQKHTGISRRTAIEALKTLESLDMIRSEAIPGKATLYRISPRFRSIMRLSQRIEQIYSPQVEYNIEQV